MAYLDIARTYQTDVALQEQAAAPAPDAKAKLSPLEWSVVALARNDRMSSLNRPGRIAVAMAKVFGTRPSNVLADPRLEALRRLAVLAWHRGYAIASQEIQAFKAAGFSIAQYELVLASISRGRNANNQRAA